MPDQDVSNSEFRRRGLEHASANAGVETTCPYSTCEGPYRNPGHHQECCQRSPYLPCKHDIKDLEDIKLDHSGQRLVDFQVSPGVHIKLFLIVQCRVLPSW